MKTVLFLLTFLLVNFVLCIHAQTLNSPYHILPDSLRPKAKNITAEEICKIISGTPYITPQAQPLFDSLINIAKKYTTTSGAKEKVKLYKAIATYYYKTVEMPDSVVKYANELLIELEKDSVMKRQYYAETLLEKGASLSYLEQFEQAITSFQQGLDFIDTLPGKIITKSRLLGDIGEMYLNLNNYKLCIEYTQRSQDLKAYLIDSSLLWTVYSFNCNATASYINEYYETGNKGLLDSAEEKLQEGYTAQRMRDTLVFISTYNLLRSKIEYARSNYVLAKKYIDISVSPTALTHDIYSAYIKDERTAMHSLILLKTGDEAEANRLVKENLNELKPAANNAFFELFYKEMYGYNKQKKNYAAATAYLEKLVAFTKERKVLENRGVVYEADKRYNSEKIKSQLLQSRLTVTQQKQKLISTLYIVSTVFLLLCWIIVLFYSKNKRNRILAREHAKHTEIIKEKNEELQQQILQLEDYQYKLEQDYQLKNRLISIIGHDIITPLKFIIRVAKSLFEKRDKVSKETFDETLHLVVDSCSSLHSMASNMLNWIKHHDKNMQFIAAGFELKDLVKSVLTNAAPMAETKNIPLVNKVPDNTVLVQYKDLLQTLLLQLITNSIKYSEHGLIQVGAEVNENNVAVTVTDEGIGIPQNMIEELLESNKNIVSESHELKGQGFGFLIIKDMLKLLQGSMSISSKINEGTSITISIPKNIIQAA